MSRSVPRIVLLSGGVGGAKMAEGLYHSRFGGNLSVIGNVADDQSFHGLWVSPDIDTLTYTLAGKIDGEQGWGLKNETSNTLNALSRLGCDTWMSLGDKDFATHIYRTQQRNLGIRASVIADHIATKLGVTAKIILPTDQIIQNRIRTEQGWLDFQTYFVRQRCQGEVLDIDVAGIEEAYATQEALNAISQAELIIIAPSNPIVSIAPIISIPGIKDALLNASAPVVAVSPLINGQTVRGPADHMMRAAGFSADVMGVAQCYQGVINAILIDQADRDSVAQLEGCDLNVMVADTLMTDRSTKVALAELLVSQMVSTLVPREVS
jgi:LPPG:FO 2-phospho-L-lactate transferase